MKSTEFIVEDALSMLETIVAKVKFGRILFTMLKQKYPKAKFVMKNPEEIITPNEGYGHGKPGLGIFAFSGCEIIKGKKYVGVMIEDAYTGNYKGVLVPAIEAATKQMLQLVPDAKPAIIVGSDESFGAWQHIAKKLKYKLIDISMLDDGGRVEW